MTEPTVKQDQLRALREAKFADPVKHERPKPAKPVTLRPTSERHVTDVDETVTLRAEVARLTLALAERECPSCKAAREANAERARRHRAKRSGKADG